MKKQLKKIIRIGNQIGTVDLRIMLADLSQRSIRITKKDRELWARKPQPYTRRVEQLGKQITGLAAIAQALVEAKRAAGELDRKRGVSRQVQAQLKQLAQ